MGAAGVGAGTGTAGGSPGLGGLGSTGLGGRGPGRAGFGGHHGGRGYGSRYGHPGTFTGYGDPYGEHRDYYARRGPVTAVGPTGENVRVVDLQRALKARGYYRGSVNGRFGPSSVQALERFRQERGIAPANFLDATTVSALGLRTS